MLSLTLQKNCIDRHLENNADKTAIIFEPNDTKSEAEYISFRELHGRVNKFANVLKSKGVNKGEIECVYTCQ